MLIDLYHLFLLYVIDTHLKSTLSVSQNQQVVYRHFSAVSAHKHKAPREAGLTGLNGQTGILV
jgi:hypothetical protein